MKLLTGAAVLALTNAQKCTSNADCGTGYDGCCRRLQSTAYDGGDLGTLIPNDWKTSTNGPGTKVGAYYQYCGKTAMLKQTKTFDYPGEISYYEYIAAKIALNPDYKVNGNGPFKTPDEYITASKLKVDTFKNFKMKHGCLADWDKKPPSTGLDLSKLTDAAKAA